MKPRTRPSPRCLTRLSIALVAATVAAGCTTTSQPAAPLAPSTNTNAAADGSTLKATAPSLVAPVSDLRLEQDQVTLQAGAATATFSNGIPFGYRFQLFGPGGGLLQQSALMTSPSWMPTVDFDRDTRYTWRVRAEFENGVGPWSGIGSFLSRLTPISPCAHMSDPIGIIACWLSVAWDDEVGPGEHVDLLMGVAFDFNRAGVPSPANAPWGVLVKTTGNNCAGFSCDILCTGHGNDQWQIDILIDEHIPAFGSFVAQPRYDVCIVPEEPPDLDD